MLDGVKERMEFVEKKYPEIYTKAKLSFLSMLYLSIPDAFKK